MDRGFHVLKFVIPPRRGGGAFAHTLLEMPKHCVKSSAIRTTVRTGRQCASIPTSFEHQSQLEPLGRETSPTTNAIRTRRELYI